MDPTAPLVAILSADRDLLQIAARTLKSHAYRVRTHSDVESLAMLWEQAPADFLLIDDDHPQFEDAARLPDATPEQLTYAVALHDFRTPLANFARCEHEFHDVVSKPFRSGETLARLRAGAALLNFERQRARGRGRAPLAGILSRAGFLHALDGHLGSAPNRPSAPLTALLAGIDAFDDHADRLSAKDVDEALRIAAELLSEAGAKPRWIARCQPSVLVCAWSEPPQQPLETLAEAIHAQTLVDLLLDSSRLESRHPCRSAPTGRTGAAGGARPRGPRNRLRRTAGRSRLRSGSPGRA
jgi:GGDEF domain-containing protein